MADVINPNLSLVEPEVGGSVNTWGNKLNQNFSILDDEVFARIKRVGDIFTGTVGFISGTAANPSIHFGDTNTGIFGGGNDTLSVSVAGSTNVTFTPSLVTVGTALQANATSVSTLTASGTVTAPRLNGATTLELQTGGTTKVTVDNAGNAGLGVVPSAWLSNRRVLQLGGAASVISGLNNTFFYNNVYTDISSVDRYLTTGNTAQFFSMPSTGGFALFTAPSGTAGAPITFTQAMTLTAPSTYTTLQIAGANSGGGAYCEFYKVDGTRLGGSGCESNGDMYVGSRVSASTIFITNSTERARITSGGYFKASNTGTYQDSNGSFHERVGTAAFVAIDYGKQASGGSVIHRSQIETTNGYALLYEGVNGGTFTYRVLANGNVQNTNNSYGAISDIKLKENVTDATPKLDSLNRLRVVNYNLIGSELKQIGLIAQEVEAIFPGLVESTPDTVEVTKTRTVEVPAVLDEEGNEVTPATTTEETYTEREPNGEVTKAVKYSALVPMLLKAVQELSAQNAALTERIAALEAK